MLSHRLRASLSFATVRIVHTLRLVGQDGVDDAMNVVQSCDGKPVSRRGESETAAFACGEGIVDVRPGDAHITSYLDLTLNVDMMDIPSRV